jgi:valyl-tRNA synthetase
MNLEGFDPDRLPPGDLATAGPEDVWIVGRLERTAEEVTKNFEAFQFAEAARTLREFTWSDFCDWYLELVKPRLRDDDPGRRAVAQGVVVLVLDGLCRLLHPIMPFVTEELWTALTGEESIVVARWPRVDRAPVGAGAAAERIAALIKLVTEVRRFRADQGLRPGQWVPARLTGVSAAGLAAQLPSVRSLARLGAEEDGFRPTATVEVGLPGGTVRVELDTSGSIDVAAERTRLTKDLTAAEKELAGTRAKLGNPKFTERAPVEVVAAVRARHDTAEADIERIRSALDALPGA